MLGKPFIAKKSIAVESILDKHPRLTREAIEAALAYAAHVVRSDVMYPASDVSA